MEGLAANHSLIICVDCGTLSDKPIAAANAKGAEVIVIDHHLGGETLLFKRQRGAASYTKRVGGWVRNQGFPGYPFNSVFVWVGGF